MGKITGIDRDPSGIVGNVVYRNTKKGTVVAKTPKKASTPRRSERQMYTRCQLGNVAANFRLFEGRLALGFEDKGAGQSEFNLYVQCNYGGSNAVFITKHERLNGACVLAPYQFTRGTLKSVGYALNADGQLVTNIRVGDLQIGAQTTVGQFTQAVLSLNTGYQEGDQITFFYGEQDEDPMTGVPRAVLDSWKVVLDSEDTTPLYNVVSSLGFMSVQSGSTHVLGMTEELQNAGAAWVHSRDDGNGNLKVGTQRLVVVSDILAEYQTTAAWKASADSYGGVNTKAVYLNPSTGGITTTNSSNNTNSGSGSSQGSGSNGSSGGSSSNANDNGNDNSGSGTNTNPTNPTNTVSAPTISGITSFTEATQVSMSGPAGASIYYTVDGSTPTDQSLEYEEPITLSATTTIKAIAVKNGISSAVASKTFTKTEAGGGGEDEPGGDDH